MSRFIIQTEGVTGPTSVTGTVSRVFDCSIAYGFSLTSAVTVDSLSPATTDSYDDTDGTLTFAAPHGFADGVKVQLTTSDTLPTGLDLLTDYFVIVVDENVIKLAATVGGDAVSFSDDGVGDITVTAEALAGGQFVVEWSNDGVNYVDGTSQNITEAGVFGVQVIQIPYKYIRVTWVVTAGQLSTSNYFVTKHYE